MNNLSFGNNLAGYGLDVGSFGIKYLLNGISDFKIMDVASSQTYRYTFTISIVDFDNHVMIFDSESLIEIKP